MAALELVKLRVKAGNRLVCQDLNLCLGSGQMLGILGRNGVGKTTLLHTIMGFRKPEAGLIRFGAVDSATLSRRQLAREVGLLFQESDSSLPATVLETVLLGRHPYADNLLWDSEEDVALANRTLSLLALTELRARQVSSLSGGEKQRLAMALLMAQSPRLYLLDEPSNHLDIDFQLKILELLTTQVRSEHRGLVMASHDINLVARFCDRVLLLLGDGLFVEGPTPAVLEECLLERAFSTRLQRIEHNGRDYFLPR